MEEEVCVMRRGAAGVSGPFGFGAFDLSLGIWPLATLKFRHLSCVRNRNKGTRKIIIQPGHKKKL